MTFLAPWFLIAVLAGAIPVVLHMIQRRRATELPFPTLRFLRASVEQTRRRRRIRDLLLMVLRVAALVLVAVGLARPTITGFSRLWGAGLRSAVVVVLDNSASMGAVDMERARLETARAAVRQILDQLGETDQVALVVIGGAEAAQPGRLERTQEGIRQRLARCRASYEGADLVAKVDEARKLLASSDAANKQIYVVTDMQARSWESATSDPNRDRATRNGGPCSVVAEGSDYGKSATTERGPPYQGAEMPGETGPPLADGRGSDWMTVIVVDCHRSPKPNVAVARVRLVMALPIAGVPVRATVELRNASSIAQARHAELVLDGVKQATSAAIELPPGGRAQHEFRFEFPSGGLHRGEVRLVGRDGLALDDRRWFAKTVDRELNVAVVRGRQHEIPYLDDTFYLCQALDPGESAPSAIHTTVLDADALATEPLSKFRVVFCVNLPALDERAAASLAAYVADGGSLVWICGDRVEPAAYNRMNAAADGTLLPGRLLEASSAADQSGRDSWNVTFLDKTHPALADLTEPVALFESILVYRHVRLDTSQTPGAWVVARLDDGECLLAQRRVGRGRVVLLGTSCQVDWTNLPLRPIFLPLVLRLTYELAGAARGDRELLAGSPLVLSCDPTKSAPGGAEIERPNGERVRLGGNAGATGVPPVPATNGHGQDARGTLLYSDTHEPGIYVVRPLGPTASEAVAVAVNPDADESDPRTITVEELGDRLAGAALVVANGPDELAEVFRRLREGHSLWDIILSTVLVLLVVETYLANRFRSRDGKFSK